MTVNRPCHTPFSILNQSVVLCKILTVASWPPYRFLRRQVRWSGTSVSLRVFQFAIIHTVEGFSVVNETEVDVFLEFPCYLCDPANVANLVSGSSAFSKPSLNIWRFLVHIILKLACKILSITLLAWEMSAIVWWFEHSLDYCSWEWGYGMTFPLLWLLDTKSATQVWTNEWNVFLPQLISSPVSDEPFFYFLI